MITYLIKDMAAVFRFLPYGLVAGIVVAILLSAINDRRVKKCKEPFSVLGLTCFVMYSVIILFITYWSRESGSSEGIDLKLFSTWGINERNNAYVIENILLFIPYGFVSAWAMKPMRRFSICFFWGLLTSTAIECMQLFTGRGVFQIDDILTNTLGALVGYIFFRCILNEERTGREKTRWGVVILSVLFAAAMVMAVISLSSESVSDSNQLSMQVAKKVIDVIDEWLSIGLNSQEKVTVIAFVHPLLRKIAHASEYAALSVVIGFGYQMMKRRRAVVVNYFYGVMTCGLIAVTDEMLQKYVFFRTGRVMDVVIDICGAVIGGCVYVFLSELLFFLSESENM